MPESKLDSMSFYNQVSYSALSMGRLMYHSLAVELVQKSVKSENYQKKK